MPYRASGGGGGGSSLAINANHFFADDTARDAYFTAHPAELVSGLFVSVGSGYQQWDGAAWQDKTAVVRGPAGIDGRAGFDAENKDVVQIAGGMAVTGHASGVGVLRASDGAVASAAVGLMSADCAVGVARRVISGGQLTLADWTAVIGAVSLTAKAHYFLGSTPGTLSATPPTASGHVLQRVGFAASPDTLVVEIEQPVRL